MNIPSSMVYAYAALKEGIPVRQRRAEPDGRHPRADRARAEERVPAGRQGLQDRPDADQDDHRARPEGAPDRRQRLVLDQHPRQPRRRGARRSRVVQDEGREQEVGPRLHPAAGPVPGAVQGPLPRRADQLLSAARRQQGRLGQHRPGRVARLPDAAQDQLPVPRLDPRGADRARPRRCSSTWRSGPA